MAFAPPQLTRVSQQPIGAGDGTCFVDGFCVSAAVLTEALAAGATLAFAVAFLFALARLHEASDALDAERERTRNERDALADFVDSVASTAPENPGLTDGGPRAVAGSGTGSLSSVVDAYRDTVLELEHYDAEYDDTLAEHMAAEFGDDVALAVRNGAILSPQLQQTLCASGVRAKERRERLLSALDAEADSLSSCRRALAEVDATIAAVDSTATRERAVLVEDWQAVREATEHAERVLEERQDDIHGQRHVVGSAGGPTTLYEYVYDELPTSYPVLSAGTDLLRRAREHRRGLSRMLAAH